VRLEAALIAADRAPARGRDYFGFLGWRGHDPALWAEVLAEAHSRAAAARAGSYLLYGADRDPRAIEQAQRNAERAGINALVSLKVGALADAAPPGEGPGLLCTNPPYGMRLEAQAAARALHEELGRVLRARFQGWEAAILTGAPSLGLALGLRAHRTHSVWNGAIECRLLRISVGPQSEREVGRLGKSESELQASPGAIMFANRVTKNLKRLGSWARREGVSCYRLYDADMPEYAFAIDQYQLEAEAERWLCVQEYAAPAEIEREAVRRRRAEVLAALPQATGVASARIRVRTRRRQRQGEQYAKLGAAARFHRVREGGLAFEVNFEDYLDTGLFLDQRLTRERLRAAARGQRFLNLFGYTGTATVYAASGGARTSVTVDLSNTYLEWAQRNLALNALAGPQHAFVRADCREWLAAAARAAERFDLIYLDPPTFSNSKRMDGVLDLQRDHAPLIDACAAVLAPAGLIVFATNAQRFTLDGALAERFEVRDISAATLPRDFDRNPRIHRCFELRVRGALR
jgi:23S rRNA (guanine2445-N2)-methyltransferase / 23S rRNA (guanine2069-N7)-methyltransferase